MAWKEGMTVKQALNEKRKHLKGKVKSLTLCKKELFYELISGSLGNGADASVYPVSHETVAKEAKFFGVDWMEI